MRERNWRSPNLQRDLALIGIGIVAVALLIGGVIGVALDVVFLRRHRGTL